MNLVDLPLDLLVLIIQHLDKNHDISSVIRTNSLLYHSLSHDLYQHDARSHNSSALAWAAQHNSIPVATCSLSHGANINRFNHENPYRNAKYFTPLSVAAIHGHEAIARLLLTHGANPNGIPPSLVSSIRTAQFPHPVALAASNSHERIIRLLLAHGAKPEQKILDVQLFRAGEGGALPIARVLLEHHANPDAIYDPGRGDSVLMEAAKRGHNAIVRLLLEYGANPWLFRNLNCALSWAIWRNHPSTVEILLDVEGLDEKINGEERMTPLAFAVYWGKRKMAELLLGRGVRVDPVDEKGWTPLLYAVDGAVDREPHELTKLLVANGADVRCGGPGGLTALHITAGGECEADARLLIEHGAEVDACTEYGETPLLMAAAWGQLGIARILIQNGADVNPRARVPWHVGLAQRPYERLLGVVEAQTGSASSLAFFEPTPLLLAAANGYDEICCLLLQNHAVDDYQIVPGLTARAIAADKEMDKVVCLLDGSDTSE